MKNKKLAYLLLTSVGAGLLSKTSYTHVNASEPYRVFHIYSSDEVEEIKSEFDKTFDQASGIVDSLPSGNSKKDFRDLLSWIYEESASQFSFSRGYYKNYSNLISQLEELIEDAAQQLKDFQRLENEKGHDIRESQTKTFNQKKKELRTEYSNIRESLKSLCSQLAPDSELMVSVQNLGTDIKNGLKKLESLKFSEKYSSDSYSDFEEYLCCVFEPIEEDLDNLKNNVNLVQSKVKAQKIKEFQIKIFSKGKKELTTEYLWLQKELDSVYKELESDSELSKLAQDLSKNINIGLEQLKLLDFSDEFFKDSDSGFEENLSRVFEPIKEHLTDLKSRMGSLQSEISDKKIENERIQKIKVSRMKLFDQKKKDLAEEYSNIQKSLNLISPGLESESELANSVQDLNKKIDNALERLEAMSFLNEYITGSDSDFERISDTVFESYKEDLSTLTSTLNTLQSYAEKIRIELEKAYIDSAKDDLLTELEDFDQDIRTEFSCSELEDKSIIEYIDSIRSDLCASLNNLKSRVSSMTNRDEKASIERDFGFFKKKYVRLLERKKRKVESYLARKQQEVNIENLHDFSAQLEMLRQGTATISDVVGGYGSVINRMNELIENIAQCSETGKGVPSKGMVLYGKPGVGKTSLVQAVAAAKNLNCVILKKGTSLGDMSAEIVKKFSEAETLTDNGTKTVVLLIDEIDAIGSTRIPGKTDKETVALLGALDKLKSNSNIAVIATTNIISSVDEAVTRSGRLEELVEVAGPDESEVFDIIKIAIAGYKIEEGVSVDSFASRFVSSFRKCTGADIKRAVEKAVQRKMKRTECTRLSEVTLAVSDLEEVVKNSRSSY